MKKFLLAASMLTALALPAKADAVNNLTFGALPNPVPQSASDPCVICATTQAHNPTIAGVLFGYNNFNSQGNDDSFNLFSSQITGAFANNDNTTVTPYTRGFLRSFLELPTINDFNLTFGIAVDINTAHNNEHLNFFQLIDLDAAAGSRIVFDLRNRDMPVIDNGNGKADYLISGFDLSGIPDGHRLLFRADWSGASDGGESFYIVPQVSAVPSPIVGAGIPGLVAACGGMFGLNFWRRRRNGGALPA
jgi:hypothetical protein